VQGGGELSWLGWLGGREMGGENVDARECEQLLGPIVLLIKLSNSLAPPCPATLALWPGFSPLAPLSLPLSLALFLSGPLAVFRVPLSLSLSLSLSLALGLEVQLPSSALRPWKSGLNCIWSRRVAQRLCHTKEPGAAMWRSSDVEAADDAARCGLFPQRARPIAGSLAPRGIYLQILARQGKQLGGAGNFSAGWCCKVHSWYTTNCTSAHCNVM